MDKMDSNKNVFPREGPNKSKDLDRTDDQKVKIGNIGAICDGAPIPAVCLLVAEAHYSGDSNTYITALHRLLCIQARKFLANLEAATAEDAEDATKEMGMSEAEKKVFRAANKVKRETRRKLSRTWPKKFYLQLDNAPVNKSQAMFHYLAWLVQSGIFKTVRIAFMMVGHTHDIIDQLFSRVSMYLRQNKMLTIAQYMRDLPLMYRYHMEVKASNKEDRKVKRTVSNGKCRECSAAVAVVSCAECDRIFCKACDDGIHERPSEGEHVRVLIAGPKESASSSPSKNTLIQKDDCQGSKSGGCNRRQTN